MTPGETNQSRMRRDAAGPVAGFLGQLALGGLVGRLALVDGSRRDLQQRLAHGMAIDF